MDFLALLGSKPVLIGLHLGFAIIGIDAFLWYAGNVHHGHHDKRTMPFVGLVSFLASWFVGGFYYVKYYGTLVKPIIKAGLAPWAHAIAMETKEHIFLFIVPLAITVFLIALLPRDRFESLQLRRHTIALSILIAVLGLAIGALGFIVSAAARWGVAGSVGLT